ncbi:hypothetical protein BpHYR1_008862 [Brachionus plicatilis]|uniref:Uncharacterized protein n=1 Tax=Brachionus plicatilis TaxID=10195 RepID=A0A3M7Q096_BRAPC|nr:hypothetical protein BpHYR1_008862 [Brachionus plicatilis]
MRMLQTIVAEANLDDCSLVNRSNSAWLTPKISFKSYTSSGVLAFLFGTGKIENCSKSWTFSCFSSHWLRLTFCLDSSTAAFTADSSVPASILFLSLVCIAFLFLELPNAAVKAFNFSE